MIPQTFPSNTIVDMMKSLVLPNWNLDNQYRSRVTDNGNTRPQHSGEMLDSEFKQYERHDSTRDVFCQSDYVICDPDHLPPIQDRTRPPKKL